MVKSWLVTKLSDVEGPVFGILEDRDGTLYLTSSSGLWKLNPKTLHCEKLDGVDVTYRQLVWNTERTGFYLTNYSHHEIIEFDLTTRKATEFLFTDDTGHKVVCPWGICTDDNGDLYFTDFHRVRKINMQDKTVRTIAGCTTGLFNGGFKDGNALEARFKIPCEVIWSPDNALYVSDRSNYCVRRIKDGIVDTFAGTPGTPGQTNGPLKHCKFGYIHGLLLMEGLMLVAEETGIRVIDMANETICLAKPPIDHPRVFLRSQDGSILVGTMNSILKLEDSWKYERYLWIGKLKEDSRWCYLTRLPRDIIREIVSIIVGLHGVFRN